MEEKDCVFQYATYSGEIIQDTKLITREKAIMLWDSYLPEFLERIDNDAFKDAEMAIWIDMDEEYNFKSTLKHYDSSEFSRDGHGVFLKTYI